MKYEMTSRLLDINDKIQSFKKTVAKKCNADICPKSVRVSLVSCIFAILTDIIFPAAGSTDTRQHDRVSKEKPEENFVN